MKTLHPLAPDRILKALQPVQPHERVRLVLDTDTFNEVDDQFAIVQCLVNEERIGLEAIYAAPFFNEKSTSPGDGMEKSYEEILRVLDLMNVADPTELAFRGSTDVMENSGAPIDSPAARDLISRALSATPENPLYVAAIGAITNVVSAIYLEPSIRERIVVVWLGGTPTWLDDAREFNLSGDPFASRLIFDCGVPLVQIPTLGVSELLQTTLPELEHYVRPCGPIGDFLYRRVQDYAADAFAWSKVIWDLAAAAWIINPDSVPTRVQTAPCLAPDQSWRHAASRHPIRMATSVDRDVVYANLFRRLRAFHESQLLQEEPATESTS